MKIEFTEEHKKNISIANFKKWQNPLYREMMLKARKGKMKAWNKGMKMSDEYKPGNWKGERASYSAKHYWIAYHFGKPKRCERCGESDKNVRYEWANVSRNYLRVRSDWERLCVTCHRRDGISYGEYDPHRKLTRK